jgi:hypothetical protein
MNIARLAVATLVALAIATPASAQFGGLKKKIKTSTGQEEGTSRAGRKAPVAAEQGAAPGDEGGMIVLTDEVVKQLLTGLKAGQAARAEAAKADTPYGRYEKGKAAYAAAQPKCEAAQQTFPQRMAGNQKAADKYSALTEKMVAAQSKHDYKLMGIYQDSAMAMMDPSCIVKKPEQPKEYYQWQRDVDTLVAGHEARGSGFTQNQLAMMKERAIAILQGGTPPGGASPMEKSAVSARAAELKPLLGFAEPPAPQAVKAEPAPAPTPAAAAPQMDPQMSAAASRMSECMTKNMQTHQADIEALAKRAQAAQTAKDQTKLMALADTLQRIQMAGCR